MSGLCPCPAAQVAQVLSLVVPNAVAQQSAFGQPLLDVRDICHMIQASSAIQQALQHTPAELYITMFCYPDRGSVPPALREGWLASFADWILKHRSLVNSIGLNANHTPLAEQQLGTLLRTCRLLPPGDGLPPLRLQVFKAWTVPKPAFLRELAGFQLQELSIERVAPRTPHIAAFGAMLRQLTSLRSLELSAPFSQSMPLADNCVMSAVEHLTRLTHLEMKGLRPERSAAACRA